MATAIRYDTTAWATFTVLEAKRILAFLGLSASGGLEALPLRLNGFVNTQEVIRVDAHTLVLRMNDCRAQSTRSRRGLDFPCRSVGEVEYAEFAHAIDPRIGTVAWSARPTPTPRTSTAPGSSRCRQRRPKAADPWGSLPARGRQARTQGDLAAADRAPAAPAAAAAVRAQVACPFPECFPQGHSGKGSGRAAASSWAWICAKYHRRNCVT